MKSRSFVNMASLLAVSAVAAGGDAAGFTPTEPTAFPEYGPRGPRQPRRRRMRERPDFERQLQQADAQLGAAQTEGGKRKARRKMDAILASWNRWDAANPSQTEAA